MCCGKEEEQGWSQGYTDASLGQARHLRLPGGVSHYLRELGSYGRIVSRNGQPRFQKGLSGHGRVEGGEGRARGQGSLSVEQLLEPESS